MVHSNNTRTELDPARWAGDGAALTEHVKASNARALAAYAANPTLVYEHANIERATAQGGYGRRQLYELVQNGADALVGTRRGRIHVVLTDDALYCANEGEPIDIDGVTAILSSHISRKRGVEIGRFGLGFKSVLGVTDRPEFYSWSGSFSFDSEWCRAEILDHVPDLGAINEDDRTPTLRLARPADAKTAADADPVLCGLMEWATTVVKLPRTLHADRPWLSEDLEQFPGEFMIFSPHVERLRLEDRGTLLDRTITLIEEDGVRHLSEGQEQSRWRVFEIPEYRPSPDALQDAGELAHRESVPLIWAVPTHGRIRQHRGRFWAFFPTEYETTLAGIINAPWKTNEDRQNLLAGPFNEELIGVAVDLITWNLHVLVDPDDPGSFLELLPARGREAPSWADRLLTERFVERAAQAASLPDQTGTLRTPAELRLHPATATPRSLEHWSSYPNRPVNWCHPTVYQRDRRACAERLLGDRTWSVCEWLEALVADGSSEASSSAIKAAAALADDPQHLPPDLRHAKIVLSASRALIAADPERAFLPTGVGIDDGPASALVHSDLIGDPETHAALIHLGIQPADALSGLRAIVAGGLTRRTDWEQFWTLARSVDATDAAAVIQSTIQLARSRRQAQTVYACTDSGTWETLEKTLLPGAVVPSGDTEDQYVLIDTTYHERELDLLELLGACSEPHAGGGRMTESWFARYRAQMLEDYYADLDTKQKPARDYLVFDHETFVGPLSPILRLGPRSIARFTHAVLRALGEGEPGWTLSHRTSPTYPKGTFIAPSWWMLRNHGVLETSLGPKPCDQAVGLGLRRFRHFLPVAELESEESLVLGLAEDLDELTDEQWAAALNAADGSKADSADLGDFYAAACAYCVAPARIRCRVGGSDELREPSTVTVVTSRRSFRALTTEGTPVVLATTEQNANELARAWAIRPEAEAVQYRITYMPSALGTTVGSRFPDLAFARGDIAGIALQPCESILEVTYTNRGRSNEEKKVARDTDGTILYDEGLSESELVAHLSEIFELDLEPEDIDTIVDGRREAELRERLQQVALEPDAPHRLACLLDAETLGRRLPQGLLDVLAHRGLAEDALSAARAALAVYGVSVLREYRDDLERAGWSPPTVWSAGQDVRSFVRDLGFDPVFAGRQRLPRPPREVVPGPAVLPSLHDYQRLLADGVRELIRSNSGRALLSLPTGAGKTRIAIEAVIEAVVAGDVSGPILWIGQTEELCEQAVQTWSYVWRAMGLPHQDLVISRLWGGNEADPAEDGVHIVVTTIDKIGNRVESDDYAWLAETKCLLIDEAHGSTTPSYTSVLNWLGLGRGKERIPLIGLTATPFRGTSAEQTERLVRRYNGRRLDHGIFEGNDDYRYLQDLGVLAHVDHMQLEGTEIVLSDEELSELQQRRRLPSNVGERIGADRDRNSVLIDTIRHLDDSWPALLFAASVDHAQTLAALLTLDGVPAAAISGQTERNARRHYIEEFRTGGIRVLTNYNVLTQGFDAPATRAVIVARPTFSANLYQQMIGRGLRGPLNGGKDRCLIVNVADNIAQYGESLAFYDFEYLWSRKDARR